MLHHPRFKKACLISSYIVSHHYNPSSELLSDIRMGHLTSCLAIEEICDLRAVSELPSVFRKLTLCESWWGSIYLSSWPPGSYSLGATPGFNQLDTPAWNWAWRIQRIRKGLGFVPAVAVATRTRYSVNVAFICRGSGGGGNCVCIMNRFCLSKLPPHHLYLFPKPSSLEFSWTLAATKYPINIAFFFTN